MGIASALSRGRLDQLCRQLGWDIDERNGQTIGLYFKGDGLSPRRTVYVSYSEGNRIMLFACNCQAEFTDGVTPDALFAAILHRNEDVTLGAWMASLDEGNITLGLRYTALAAGVNADNFKLICSVMIEEVAKLEAILHRKGLI